MKIALQAVVLLSVTLLAYAAGPIGSASTRAAKPKIVFRNVVPRGARSNLLMTPKTSQPKCIGGTNVCLPSGAPQILTKAAKKCSIYNQCSFVDKFNKNSGRWLAADGYANGQPFNSWWSKSNAVINVGGKKAFLSISKVPAFGKPFRSGQLQTNQWYGYGCYEVRMKPVKQQGLISTFFTYTGPYDKAPGASGTHNEVDIEFVWKKQWGKLMMQANYFSRGKGGNEKYINLKFDPTKKFHNYAFKWTAKKIDWYVDGKKVYTAKKNVPKTSAGTHKIMMNLWPVSSAAAGWGGYYAFKGKRTAAYEAIRFTKGANCKIKNNFS